MPEHDIPPRPPEPPDPADCCGEGCVNCIHDVYEAALERHRRALADWEARRQPPASQDDGPGS